MPENDKSVLRSTFFPVHDGGSAPPSPSQIASTSVIKSNNGFQSLNEDDFTLRIIDNDLLTSVEAFSALTRTGGLEVSGNAPLPNVDGFSSMAQVDGDFTVTDNPMLPTCDVENLRDSIGESSINGTITIDGNNSTATC